MEVLSAADMKVRYLRAMADDSWCVDLSGDRIKPFKAASNRYANSECFALEFPAWAKAKGVKVRPTEYKTFKDEITGYITEHLPHVYGSSFKPSKERFFTDSSGMKLANIYQHKEFPMPCDASGNPLPAGVAPVLVQEHFDRLWPDMADQKRIVQILADQVQNGHRRIQFGVIITGEPATGKSTIIKILALIFGKRFVYHERAIPPVYAKHSEILSTMAAVAFDDADIGDRATYERLKHTITTDYQWVNLKGQQKAVSQDVFARIYSITNDPNGPFPVPQDDRRFLVMPHCTHRVSKEETAEFFRAKYIPFLQHPDTPALLYHWLNGVDLSDFDPGSTIQTEAHQKMSGLVSSELDGAMLKILATFKTELPTFHINNLLQGLDEQEVSYSVEIVRDKLHAFGYEPTRRVVPGCADGAQINLWKHKSCSRAPSLTDAQAQRIEKAYNLANAGLMQGQCTAPF